MPTNMEIAYSVLRLIAAIALLASILSTHEPPPSLALTPGIAVEFAAESLPHRQSIQLLPWPLNQQRRRQLVPIIWGTPGGATYDS